MPKKLLVALLALITLTSACSGGGVDTTDGATLFADAMSGAGDATSARFEGTFRMSGVNTDAPDTPVEMSMAGVYDQPSQAMQMSMDIGELFASGASGALADEIPPGFEGFFDEPMEFITIGTEGWLRWGLLSLFTGKEGVWLSLDAGEMESATESFGFGGQAQNPTELLAALAKADAQVENVGTETVRGVETNHLRALVDVQKLAGELDAAEQAKLEGQLGDLSNAAYPIDVWIGADDGLIYRYQIDMNGRALVSADAPTDASVFVSFEFFEHGLAADITAPPADEVVDGTSLLGGLG